MGCTGEDDHGRVGRNYGAELECDSDAELRCRRRLVLTQSVGGTVARQELGHRPQAARARRSSAAGHSVVGLLYGGGVKKHGASVASCPAYGSVVFFLHGVWRRGREKIRWSPVAVDCWIHTREYRGWRERKSRKKKKTYYGFFTFFNNNDYLPNTFVTIKSREKKLFHRRS